MTDRYALSLEAAALYLSLLESETSVEVDRRNYIVKELVTAGLLMVQEDRANAAPDIRYVPEPTWARLYGDAWPVTMHTDSEEGGVACRQGSEGTEPAFKSKKG